MFKKLERDVAMQDLTANSVTPNSHKTQMTKNILKILALFLMCLSASGAPIAAADSLPKYLEGMEDWEKKLWVAQRLHDKGNLEEALKQAKESLQLMEKRYGSSSPLLTRVLTPIGRIYSDQKNFSAAEPFFVRTVSLGEHRYGSNSTEFKYDLMDLAGNFVNKKEYGQAEKIYLRLVASTEAKQGSEHTDLVTVLRPLAALYRKQGRPQESEAIIKRTMKLWKTPSATVFGVKFDGTAQDLQNLAALQVDAGNVASAHQLYSEALTLVEEELENSRKKYNGGHPGNGTLARVIGCLERFAKISRRLGKNDEATTFDAQAKTLRGEMQGDALELPASWGQQVFEIEFPKGK
jgi:tetratricopeptide (TPR) repeat protein